MSPARFKSKKFTYIKRNLGLFWIKKFQVINCSLNLAVALLAQVFPKFQNHGGTLENIHDHMWNNCIASFWCKHCEWT